MKQIFKSGAVIAALVGIIILLSVNHQRMMGQAETAGHASASQSANAVSKLELIVLHPATLPSSLAQAQACNIEYIGGVIYTQPYLLSRASSVVLTGWLVDGDSHVAPDNPQLFVVNTGKNTAWSASLKLNRDRNDVAKLYGGGDVFKHSGFELDMDVKSLDPGAYHLYLIYDSSGHKYKCDNGRILRISF